MSAATLTLDGEALRFGGALVRAEVPGLWSRLPGGLAQVRRLDRTAVERLDSAGIALLSAVAERCGGGEALRIEGTPPGLDALRQAYRLDARLGFDVG